MRTFLHKLTLLSIFVVCGVIMTALAANAGVVGEKKLVIKRGYTKEAASCIECHSVKTPGIIAGWKNGRMGSAAISCYDCHAVEKDSPMASQCEGLRGTDIYISPMVSAKTCARCHPHEAEEFSKSAHAKLAGKPIIESEKFKKLISTEGADFLGEKKGSMVNRASGAGGCQACHGTEVELGPDNKPVNMTWPGGVGTRYPDGGIGNCTVCHTRHQFSVAEARKPEACASCHLGPDHPHIEIYEESKHGQIFNAHGDEWNWEAASGAWQPGDYTAPTCAVCHMSGIGTLESTHNVTSRLKWDLVHKRSEIRTGERGDGIEGDKKMRQVCVSCHGATHIEAQRQLLDNTVALYNKYWDGAVKMKKELAEKGLLKEDKWKDPYQELMYYLWHHCGRRARHGAAMNGPDYSHWHGFFQVFQVYKDMEDLYNWRIKNNKIEDLSPVMSTGPI
ncbi:Hydroxylamine oxidoreductase [Halodesulfovibrio sp. MK-HDV]|nr:Hydroxylamine oxidoreductase [Halodesulfovibrio sp. MK-HDV]